MSNYEYNAFTGNLDLVGSGASYIDGVVATPASLPTTLGTPALDSVYLAKAGSGVWLVNRRPGGLYCRVANNGNANDWQHLGAFPEVNADGNWELYNSADPTKELKFDLSGLPTATTRTVNAPDGNGKMLVEGQSIGATTRNTIAATTLSANNGTLTASAPVLDLSQTWNNAAVTFTGLRFNVTNTASASQSALLDLQVGGSSQFAVWRNNTTRFFGAHLTWFTTIGFETSAAINGATPVRFCAQSTSGEAGIRASGNIVEVMGTTTTSPQTFRLYNTTDAGLTNFERLFLRWNANVAQIGTEAGGTGSARDIEFQHGGTTRFSLIGNTIRFATTNVSLHWQNATMLRCFSNGNLTLTTSNQLDFGLLQFGGTTSSFPALKRSSTALQVRLADDSAFAPLSCSVLSADSIRGQSTWIEISDSSSGPRFAFYSHGGTLLRDSGYYGWHSGASLTSASTGDLRMYRSGAGILRLQSDTSDFNRIQFGGTTTSFPALKRSSTVLQSRLADDSDFAPLQGQLRTHANAVSETITATHTLTLYDAAGTAYKVPCVAA